MKDKLDSLPLTNKHLFRVVEYDDKEPMMDLTNHEVLYHMENTHSSIFNETRHYMILNNQIDGIKILWEGNPFRFTKSTDVIRNL